MRKNNTVLIAKSSRFQNSSALIQGRDLDPYGNKISSPGLEQEILRKLDAKKQNKVMQRESYNQAVT